jgi:toxin ParE1/3/4
MGNYKLTPEAKADLRRIYKRGVREYGEAQTDKYYDAFYDRFEEVAGNPRPHRKFDHIRKGYRRCPCGVDAIYYCINDKTVEIMNIIGRQDVEEWL